MDKCRCLHETVIRDIVDVVTDLKDMDELPGFSNKKSFKSVASATRDMILVFPCIVSRSIPIDTAAMVTKAIERKAVTMLQMLFSALQISNTDDGLEYLRQFHNNLRIDDFFSVDSFIGVMDKFVANENVWIDPEKYRKIKDDMHNINYFLPDSINESCISDFKVVSNTSTGKRVVCEADDRSLANQLGVSSRLVERNGYTRRRGAPSSVYNTNGGIRPSGNGDMHTHNVRNYNMNPNANASIGNININTGGGNSGSYTVKDNLNYLKDQLLDNDVKKSNELVPTTMVVNFISNDKTKPVATQIVIGVKAKMYPVDSLDITNRLVIKKKDKNILMNFVRSTTREISFVKDFLFAIDRAKMDALGQSKKGSSNKLWKILERRSMKSKFNRSVGRNNDAAAITTLIISQEEVEYIKKMNNIDFGNPATSRQIMETMNFMGFVVTNEADETADFLFDTGDDIFETIPYRNLERESQNNDFKKIVSLMSKMR